MYGMLGRVLWKTTEPMGGGTLWWRRHMHMVPSKYFEPQPHLWWFKLQISWKLTMITVLTGSLLISCLIDQVAYSPIWVSVLNTVLYSTEKRHHTLTKRTTLGVPWEIWPRASYISQGVSRFGFVTLIRPIDIWISFKRFNCTFVIFTSAVVRFSAVTAMFLNSYQVREKLRLSMTCNYVSCVEESKGALIT